MAVQTCVRLAPQCKIRMTSGRECTYIVRGCTNLQNMLKTAACWMCSRLFLPISQLTDGQEEEMWLELQDMKEQASLPFEIANKAAVHTVSRLLHGVQPRTFDSPHRLDAGFIA